MFVSRCWTLMFLFSVSVLWFGSAVDSLRAGDCEVCVTFLGKFVDTLSDKDKELPATIEDKFRKYCKDAKGKDNRFCYYVGGLEESATSIVGELSKPISWSMPVDKVCEKLHKKDSQICDLRYDKTFDLKTVDLKKLRVRDLRKILDGWGETCEGCIEKTDFVNRIEELKPQYVKDEL